MPLNKKIIFIPIFLLISTSLLSGCIIQDLLFGASFNLNSYTVTDSDGFPALKLFFSASNKVTLKMYDAGLDLMDADYFYADSNTSLNIGSYFENIEPGNYHLRVYNPDNNKIHEEKFNLKGPSLSILSCDQKWWKDESSYVLIGLELTLTNTGDTPAYPYSLNISTESTSINGFILPNPILPGSTETVYTSIYHRGTFKEDEFTVEIFDINDNSLSTSSFSFEVSKNVYSTYYDISALDNSLVCPYVDFLYDYYKNLERIYIDDYSVFVFDKYDEAYIDLLIDCIIQSLDYSDFKFNTKTDKQKVEYIASFVQGLEYKKDSEVDDSYEYPNYPVETLFNGKGGGDCEDKAILTANLLDNLGYETALLRLPEHMAVGVKLGEDTIRGEYYVDDYDFLETTTPGFKCGQISEDEYKNPSNLTVYPIEDRPLLLHSWKNDIITTYKNTKDGNLVKAIAYTTNLGKETAENIIVEGLFLVEDVNLELKNEQVVIDELKPGDKKKTVITVEIPDGLVTRFETRVYLDGEIVDSEISKGSFP